MKGMFLKIIAVVAFSAVVFPFLICSDTAIYGNLNFLRLLYYYGIGAVIAVLGYLGAHLSKSHKKLRIPIRIAGILTFGAGFLSLPMTGDFEMVFALGVSCIFMFFIGERTGYRNFADMFPLGAFGAYIIVSLACYIISLVKAGDNELTVVPDIILAAFVLELAAAALLVNQSGIFDRANMRKETKASLPKGLTSYNAALVLAFTVTGLILCIFRKQIAWALRQGAKIVIKAVFMLMNMFNAEPMEITTDDGEGGSLMGFLQSPAARIFEALVIIALIVLIIVFRKKIFKAVRSFFSKLGALLGGRPEESEHPEFTDVFENYSSSSHRGIKTDNLYALKRKFDAESDPCTKYRLGYRILLFRIKAVNQRLSRSDTTSVQAERGYERFGKSEMNSTVKVYDGIRYSCSVPDSEQIGTLRSLVEKK